MSFLTRTYPFKQSKHLLKDSSIFGFIIWVILYFLQPFGLCLYQGNKCFVATLFGLVTFWMPHNIRCNDIEVFASNYQALAYLA